jgi:hypothetical protein
MAMTAIDVLTDAGLRKAMADEFRPVASSK